MPDGRVIVINRKCKGRSDTKSVTVPAEHALVSAAIELRNASTESSGTYAQCGARCVGIYYPRRLCTTTDIDLFTGEEGASSKSYLPETCTFFYVADDEKTAFAIASFDTDPPSLKFLFPADRTPQETLFELEKDLSTEEGAPLEVTLGTYERNKALREACIRHYGSKCAACGMTFGERYGELAAGLIHVHHLQPLAATKASHVVDPITELVPLCPNCHSVAHLKDPPLHPSEIAKMIQA